MYRVILILMICLAGCKTYRATELHTESRENYHTEQLSSGKYHLTVSDSIQRRITHSLTGHITIWSPPDSTGKQYKVAEADLQSNTEEEEQQTTSSNTTGSLDTQTTQRGEKNDTTEFREEKQTETKVFPFNSWLIIIGVATVVIIRLLSKKKK